MCNEWCYEFVKQTFSYWPDAPRVLEVGARDINGSVRSICEPRAKEYIGADIEMGKGVDVLADANNLTAQFEEESFDVVLSTEMVEHIDNWPTVFYEMMAVLKPDGLLILTTRSIGFEIHDYPHDYWRYSSKDMKDIFKPAGDIKLISDDMTYGFPCGAGVAVQKKKSKNLSSWKAHLRKSIELYNVIVSDRITYNDWLVYTKTQKSKSTVNPYKNLLELPLAQKSDIRWLDIGFSLKDIVQETAKRNITLYTLDKNSEVLLEQKESAAFKIHASDELLPFPDNSLEVVSLIDYFKPSDTPENSLKESRRILKSDGVLFLTTVDPIYATRSENNKYRRPPSYWVWLLKNMGFDVALRFGHTSAEVEILAMVQDSSDESESTKRAFQALRSEFAKDIFIDGESLHVTPRTPNLSHSFLDDSLIYILNPHEHPLSVSINLHSETERHPDIFWENLKLHYSGHEKSGSGILHHWNSCVVPPGGCNLKIHVENEPITVSYLHMNVDKKDNDDFLLELSFDHYQRYKLVEQVLHALGKKYLSILDVGGAQGYLQLFTPQYDVTVLDVLWEDNPKELKYDGFTIPFKENTFDVVVTADTLEHISDDQREQFIKELSRVSGETVILIGPFDEPNVENAEIVLQNFIELQLKKKDPFLDEHSLFKLPNRKNVRSLLARNGFSVTEIPNGYLPRWLSMQLADYSLKAAPEQAEGKARFNALYNSYYFPYDNRFPAYRVAMIATREAPSFNLQANLKTLISSKEEPAYPVLWNVASLIVSLSNYGIIREKDFFLSEQGERLSRLLDHTKELEREIARRHDHTEKLLEHLKNLESSLEEERSHRSGLVHHTENLESLLRFLENDSSKKQQHTDNLETLIKGLEEHIQNLDQERLQLIDHSNNLAEENRTLTQHMQRLTDHIANLEKKEQEWMKHSDNLQEIIAEERDYSHQFQNQIGKMQEHISNIESNADHWKTHSQNLESMLSSMQTHAVNLEQLLTEKENHNQNLNDHIQNLGDHIQNLETSNEQLKIQNSSLNQSLHELHQINDKTRLVLMTFAETLDKIQESAKPFRRLYRDLDEKFDVSQIEYLVEPLKTLISAMNKQLEERDRLRLALEQFSSSRSYKIFKHVGILPSLEDLTTE